MDTSLRRGQRGDGTEFYFGNPGSEELTARVFVRVVSAVVHAVTLPQFGLAVAVSALHLGRLAV